MTNLTQTQKTILEAAATRPDGSIQPLPEKIKGGAAIKVITALEKRGWIEDTSLNPPYRNWVITDEGRRAIGQEPQEAPEPSMPPVSLTSATPAATPEPETEESEEPETERPDAEAALKASFQHFLENGGNPEDPQLLGDDGIIDAMEAEKQLQEIPEEADPDFAAIARKHFPAITRETWPRIRNAIEEAYAMGHEQARKRKSGPRDNTKQAQVIELMKHPEGATIEQITQATGWNANSTRGFISGTLKKRLGLNITTLRTRNVGPNAKGGYTTYRISTEG